MHTQHMWFHTEGTYAGLHMHARSTHFWKMQAVIQGKYINVLFIIALAANLLKLTLYI